jgi:hypothetical protein
MKHDEAVQQRLFIKRVRLDPRTKDLLIWSTPNGGKRGKREAALLKAEGALAGVPDIFVAVPRWGSHGLFLEFKSATGKLSPAQRKISETLKLDGYQFAVVRSAVEAWEQLMVYLGKDA